MSENRIPHVEESPAAVSEPAVLASSAVFSPAQIELLSAMAWVNSDEDVRALQHAISEFFANRADEAMEQLWADGTWNEETLRNLKNAHYRTPYGKH